MSEPRGIDLLTPGDPTDIPEELWEEWRRDEYEADYAVDGHRLDEQEEVLAGLEENPELVARVAKRLDEITRRVARRKRCPGPLKAKIATLQRRHPEASVRTICEYLDAAVERGESCEPLKSWQQRAAGKRTWVEVYEHPGTKPLVQTYLSKIARRMSIPRVPFKGC